MKVWLMQLWDWFWYFRHGKIKYHISNQGDTYIASASNGVMSVSNCYGSTPELTKEMAGYRFKEALNRVGLEKEVTYQGEGFTLYHDKR